MNELVGVAQGEHPFSRANEYGFVGVPASATLTTGEAMPPGELQLDARRAERIGIQKTAEICGFLSRIENPQFRRGIIEDLCRIMELRLHFDFSRERLE